MVLLQFENRLKTFDCHENIVIYIKQRAKIDALAYDVWYHWIVI